jgi:hypothetical protein
MREIFPMRGVRWTRTMARLDLSSGMHETWTAVRVALVAQ